jgi:hypothetical protein
MFRRVTRPWADRRGRPHDLRSVPAKPAERPLEWPDLEGRARVLLGDSQAARWEGRVDELADEILARLDRQTDATLLRFIHMAGTRPEDYSTHHAILVMLLCALAGPRLPGWQPAWRRPLTRAALTMNIGMVPLQNELVRQAHPPTPVQRAQVDAHALRGVELLRRPVSTTRLARCAAPPPRCAERPAAGSQPFGWPG